MKNEFRAIIFSAAFIAAASSALAQTGPGGVGNSSTNRLWLRADAGISTTVDGTPVSAWNDQSGNNNHATQSDANRQPLYIANAVNGRPTLRFDGANANTALRDALVLTTNLTDVVGTLLIVGRRTALGGTWQPMFSSQRFYPFGRGQFQEGLGMWRSGPGDAYYEPATSIGINNTAPFRVMGFRQTGDNNVSGALRMFLDGTESNFTYNGSGLFNVSQTSIGGQISDMTYAFPGDIAEVIFYNQALNSAQRIIVENYLGAKYNISLGTNDRYAFDIPYGNEVIGIGNQGGETHTMAQRGILTLQESSSSPLSSGQFVLIGHDNGALALTNTNVNTTDLGSAGRRLHRVWRVDISGASSKLVRLTFNLDDYSGNVGDFRLLRNNASADFSGSGLAILPTSTTTSPRTATFELTLNDGDYITLGRFSNTPSAPSNLVYNPNTISKGVDETAQSAVPSVDDGGATVSFSLQGTVPAGVAINATTGVITSFATQTPVGTYNLTVRATNSQGFVETTVTLTVGPEVGIGTTGPGGVGRPGTNRLWLRADAGALNPSNNPAQDNDPVQTWQDQSGNTNNATAPTADRRPTFIANAVNGRPTLRFDGANASTALRDALVLTTNLTDVVGTLFIVGRQTAVGGTWQPMFSSQRFYPFGRGQSQVGLGMWRSGPGDAYYEPATSIGSDNTAPFRVMGFRQTGDNTVSGALRMFLDGTESNFTYNGSGLFNVSQTSIGGQISDMTYAFPGDIAEVIFYNQALNSAQRIIVENYLSAKYNITISNDRYTGNDAAYVNSVQGIGRASDGSVHIAANRGEGLNLVELSNSLNNGEFLLSGHNGVPAVPTSTADLPSGVLERWSRIWYLDKTGNIDARLTFDFGDANAGVLPGVAVNYRLLYRAGTSGAFSTVTTLTTSVQGDQVIFDVADANLIDGYYTIGTTNPADSPLPVELVSFTLTPKERGVLVEWETASETNNAGFILKRSENREGEYEEVSSYRTNEALRGLGTSSSGKKYAYLDADERLRSGRTYFYKLMDVDFDGRVTELAVKEVGMPREYSLGQNYPNPFNPTTTIEFSLRREGWTVLEVFNVLGQRVATLVNENLKAGGYRVEFKAAGLSSGAYFYRLRSGGFVATKKMMLVK